MSESPNVLLIDDSPGDVRLLEEELREHAGPTLCLTAAADLASGVELLARSDFDAALLDLGLPDSQHLETLARLRAAAPELPIVVLTGNQDTELPLEAVRRGAQDYLVKGTFDATLLVRTVRYAIERSKNLQALRESEERYRTLYERVDAGVFELDLEGRIKAANPALVQMLEFGSEAELCARDAGTVLFSDTDEFAGWLEALGSGDRSRSRLRLKTCSGQDLVVLATIHGVTSCSGALVGYQGMLTDVTEADRLSEQLSYEATHDALTDLANRRMFEARVRQALERVRDDVRFAVCYVDLDQFKIINDTCGHVAGDELLKQISQALRSSTRRGDVLARLGGDEFGMLFEVADEAEAVAGAERLLASIEQFRFTWSGQYFETSASVGLVVADSAVSDIEEIMSAADAACYAAKDQGGGRVYVGERGAETLNQRLREMRWVMRIKAAVNEDRLLLYEQQIESVRDEPDGPRRFEVLLRKRGEDGRIHLPGNFLPAVERYNYAATVDRWVVSATLEWLGEHGLRLGPHMCSLNLSGQSLGEPGFLDFLEHQLERSGVSPRQLCFEVTESAAIRNLAAAQKLITTLRGRGCRFALDDFGSGLSSFSYLRNLPVDYIKLDGAFTKSIGDDRINRTTVKSIADIADAMGKETVAEFVEDRAWIPLLRDLGVDYVQGYAVGAPRPLDALLDSVPGTVPGMGILRDSLSV